MPHKFCTDVERLHFPGRHHLPRRAGGRTAAGRGAAVHRGGRRDGAGTFTFLSGEQVKGVWVDGVFHHAVDSI